jgi:hypothetical protein
MLGSTLPAVMKYTLFTLVSSSVVVAVSYGGDLTPLGPIAEVGSYAGQAMDVDGGLLAVGHKEGSSYALRFYGHSPSGWDLSSSVEIGSRRAVSVAFGDQFLGVALAGSGAAGVVLEPSRAGWSVSAQLTNPDPGRFNGFHLAAASDEAVFIACNDSTQQYRDAVLVYERGAVGWQHVQTIAPSTAVCTLFGEDIDASGDMLVIGATRVLGCSGGNERGAHVYLRGDESWEHATTLQYGDTNGKWVACDGELIVSWASTSGPNSTFDYLRMWSRNGDSFSSAGSIYSGSNWGFDIYFPEGMEVRDGIITFGTCGGFWGCQTNSTTNRTVYAAQRQGSSWWLGAPLTIPSGYGSAGFGRNVKMGGGSILIGAPAYGGSQGVAFEAPLANALPCPADLNGDGEVNGADIGLFMAEWGGSGRGDLNSDSNIDAADLGMLLSMWGDC